MAAELFKGNWEDLRKEARYLENEIELKLASFSKAGSANSTFSIVSEIDSDKTPLLSSSNEKSSDNLSEEIEALLKKLSQVNGKMTEISSTTPGLLTRDAQHTLQRHRDILQDFSQEFKKTLTNLRSRREREELLHQGIPKELDKTSLNRRMDFYVKEHNSIKTSERLIDEQIAIAIETKENLVNQRFAFKKIQTRMNDLTTRFPALNNLISKINVKKRKDTVIIGLVIGVCVFLLLMYTLH